MARLRETFAAIPEGLALFDSEDRYVLWNRAYAEIYAERPDADLSGMLFQDVIRSMVDRGLYQEALGREEEWFADRMAKHRQASEYCCEQPLTDGRWLRVAERPTSDGGRLGVHIDITDLKKREASFKLLLENNPVPMWVCDRETLRVLCVNNSAVAHYGYDIATFQAMSLSNIHPPEELDRLRAAVESHEIDALEDSIWRHVKADGGVIDVAFYVRSLQFADREAILVAATDITERRRVEERVSYLAHHDLLTGLPNRAAFVGRLAAEFAKAEEQRRPFALLCADLDGFKPVNDVFGHSVGDQLLQEVSERLTKCCEKDFVARVGGDEFVVIVTEYAQPQVVADLANRLVAAIAKPFDVEGSTIHIGLSVGVAMLAEDGSDMEMLRGNADAALYRAKAEGRNRVRFFDAELDAQIRFRHGLQQDLHRAVERGELHLHYQPQTAIGGEIVGFEALLRWRHPEQGNIPPSAFIPIAEESGLIIPLGEWVLKEACNEAASWTKPLNLSVNLSPIQFQQGDVPHLIHRILLETGLSADRLELEITEGVLVSDFSRATSILRRLKSLGVRISMDDFGTGYSSLSYLQSFPFDKIKIDRSFVMNLDTNPQSSVIVRTIIGLGRGLGVPVIAEGVETARQLDFLASEGCLEAQGFFIGRPRPIADYEAIVGDFPGADEEAAVA